jgi:hypothetical protein
MSRAIVAAALFLALTGCPERTPRVETITVKVPVPVTCVDPAQIPAKPVAPEMPNDAIAALAVALGWVADWVVYGATADPLLKACAKP